MKKKRRELTKRCLLLIHLLVAMISLASAASATITGSYTLNTQWREKIENPQTVGLAIWRANIVPSDRTYLFNGPDASDHYGSHCINIFNNVGRTIWASSNEDDPDYDEFVSRLTDGVPDAFYMWFSGIGFLMPFGQLVGQQNNYSLENLQGYNIARIGLTIDSATRTIDSTADYPYAYNCQITCTIESTSVVPEPSSLAALTSLLMFGGVFAHMRKAHFMPRK